MPEITDRSPGTFCWVDSGTNDLETARAFYAAVFGWEYAPAGDDSGYLMCLKEGKPVAGLYGLSEEMLRMGAIPWWLAYVAVTDADALMGRAIAGGASPMGPVFEVPIHGRAGAFSDPTGAMCGIWQPRGHQGFGLEGEHGTVVWCELQTRDVEAAGAFYTRVFGWSRETADMPGGPYGLFKDGEAQQAGLMAITPAMGEVPPNWSIYFQVDDADATAATATVAGGDVVVPIMPIPNVGRVAVLRSADGAHFSILEPGPMA
ncbi:MAG: VOC family protein [Actinomycetota bacterium]